MRHILMLGLILALSAVATASADTADPRSLRDLAPALARTEIGGTGGEAAFKPVDPQAFDRLHEVFIAIRKTEPAIAEPPKPRGPIDSLFAGARSLFGSPTEEDLFYDAYAAYGKGDYAKAASLFDQLAVRKPDSLRYRYFGALAHMGNGDIVGADQLMSGIKTKAAEQGFLKTFHSITDPYVIERVAFKIGGFDSIDQYRAKVLAGNRMELHGDEYYEKFVDKKIYDWKSPAAKKEFDKIAGIDCGGLVQRVYMGLCEKVGLKPPFNSKLPGDALQSPKYSKRLKEDGGIPPKTAKPGDVIFLSQHDGWGHVFLFDGWNERGQPMIIEASGEGCCLRRPMPDRYAARYDGTYRWNQMDTIQKKLAGKV